MSRTDKVWMRKFSFPSVLIVLVCTLSNAQNTRLGSIGEQEPLDQVILQGEQALAEGAVRKSEDYLRRALAQADAMTSNPLDKVRVQIDFASLLILSGRNVEAMEDLESALAVLRNGGFMGTSFAPSVLINLGAVYIQTAQYRKAESVLNEAKSLLDGNTSDIRPHIDLLTNLGYLYGMTGRQKRAQAVFEEAISLTETGVANPIYIARTLTNLATLYALQRNWNLAEPALIRAQQVLDTSIGTFHPELAAVLHNLGAVYTAQKKFSNAEVVLRRALEIRTRAFGTENLPVAVTKMYLADVLAEKGQFDEAETLYGQSLQTQEQLSGPRSPDVALILENLAKVLRLKIDQQAKAMEARAKAIRQEHGLVRSVH